MSQLITKMRPIVEMEGGLIFYAALGFALILSCAYQIAFADDGGFVYFPWFSLSFGLLNVAFVAYSVFVDPTDVE